MLALGNTVSGVLKVLGGVFKFVASNADVLAVAAGALLAVLLAYKAVATVTAVMAAFKAAMAGLAVAMAAYKFGAEGAAVGTALFTTAQAVATIAIGTFTKGVGLAAAAKMAFAAASAAAKVGLIGLGIAAAAVAATLIVKLVNALIGSSDAFRAQSKELKALKDENKKYEETLASSKTKAAEQAESIKAQALATGDAIRALANLTDEQGKYNGAADEAVQRVDELNKSVDTMGLSFNATTGLVSMGKSELLAYARNLEIVRGAQAAQGEYNNILQEQMSLQAKLNVVKAKPDVYKQQLDKGIISQREFNKMTKEASKLTKEYDTKLKLLGVEVEVYKVAADRAANSEATIAVRRQEIANAQMATVAQLGFQYQMSTDQILSEASRLNGGLQEWQTMREQNYTSEGHSIEQLAAQWGLSAQSIVSSMDLTGLGLQSWAEAIQAGIDTVVNSFDPLPTKAKYSLDQMIKNMNDNAEKMRRWKELMLEIGGQLEPGLRREFEKNGRGGNACTRSTQKGWNGKDRRSERSVYKRR